MELLQFADEADIWGEDIWDVRDLQGYQFEYVKSSSHFLINFCNMKSPYFKDILKQYTKRRLMARTSFTWGTAAAYVCCLKRFLNLMSELHPDWTSLENLSRTDILEYIDFLSQKESTNKNRYLGFNMNILSSFISYSELLELEGAPKLPIYKLMHGEDYPKINRKSDVVDKYIPEYVLEQVFRYIDDLPSDTKLVLIIMYSTGLRISDTLELTYDCIRIINGQYWLCTDIRKTKLKNHKIPITSEVGKMIDRKIQHMKALISSYANPNNYIFYSTRLSNGNPISQKKVTNDLNNLAGKRRIIDEKGNLYHFRSHSFRHTYAMKTLNNGMDVVTLQDILGHSSPEMTMTYATLLDSTKREMFEKVLTTGVLSFGDNNTLNEISLAGIPKEELRQFWTTYKLNAIDTPYGVCMQRSNGKCQFAKHPPCLTCRGGNPCKDLCIGISESDVAKYKVLMSSANAMVQIGINNDRPELISENRELLDRYNLIYNSLEKGNIIYGRSNRILGEIENGKQKQ